MGRHKEFDVDEALDKALQLFWEKGFEGTSYPELSKATGVAAPGLYSAFGNKEGLFLRAIDLYDKKYMSVMSEALKEDGRAKVIARILDELPICHTREDLPKGCLGVNAALACSDSARPIQDEVLRRRQANQDALVARLAEKRGDGIDAEVKPETLARFVTAIAQGMAVQAKSGASRIELQELASFAKQLLGIDR
jgi:AcrR family transcriptional regulator